jgi:hypothetical protein
MVLPLRVSFRFFTSGLHHESQFFQGSSAMKSSSRVSGIFLLAVFAALMLAAAGTVQAQSIAVHYSDYAGSGYSGIVGTDGVVPNGYWTNVSVNWFSGSASNLVDSTDAVTTAATNVNNGVTGGGTYWWVNGPAGGVDNLLEGPWGGDGGGGAEAIPSVITGITPGSTAFGWTATLLPAAPTTPRSPAASTITTRTAPRSI